MAPKDIFGIIVRTIGLCLSLYAIWYLAFAVAVGSSILAEEKPGDARAYLISGITFLAISAALLRGASRIVRFAYSEEQ